MEMAETFEMRMSRWVSWMMIWEIQFSIWEGWVTSTVLPVIVPEDEEARVESAEVVDSMSEGLREQKCTWAPSARLLELSLRFDMIEFEELTTPQQWLVRCLLFHLGIR